MDQPIDLESDTVTKSEPESTQFQSNPTISNSEAVDIQNKSLEISDQNNSESKISNVVLTSENSKVVELDEPDASDRDKNTGVEVIISTNEDHSNSLEMDVIEDMYKFSKIPRLTLRSDSSDMSVATQETNSDIDLDGNQTSSSRFQPEVDSLTLNEGTGNDARSVGSDEDAKKLPKEPEEDKSNDCNPEKNTGDTQMEITAQAEEALQTGPYYLEYIFDSSLCPLLLAASNKADEFPVSNFLKGCKWAPDGSCLLTNSDDSTLRLFNFPSNVSHVQDWEDVQADTVEVDNCWSSALKIKEGGCVYDYCWYPFASSLDPATTCFLTTSKDTPVHLWDAMYGNLRATYLGYNDVDEPTAAYSVAFDPTGEKIYCGYEKSIRIFNISRPGRICTIRKLTGSLLPDLNQHGLISCIAFNPAWSNVYACGSYRKTIGLYMEDGTVINMLEGHTGGVTNLIFSRDGTKLYSGARSDPSLICWDLRNMGSEYKTYDRVVKTQQRIYFDLTTNDRYLISGSTDGVVRIWDTLEENKETVKLPANTDCVNGVSINPYIPVLATSTGQRHCYDMSEESNSDSGDDLYLRAKSKYEHSCSVKLWKL